MDGAPERPSGIPRLSRLPVPRSPALAKPSGVPQPSPSRSVPLKETLSNGSGARELNVPKLRASSSRNQLRSSAASTGGRETPLRTPVSRDQLRPTAGAKQTAKPLATRPDASRVASQPNRRTSTSNIRPPPCDHPTTTRPLERPPGLSPPPGETDEVDKVSAQSGPLGTPEAATRSRPSLAERTMETLARLPSSPAVSKKPSTFFEPARPVSRAASGNSRPGSSYTSDGSGRVASRQGSRPGSSDAHQDATYYSARAPVRVPKHATASTVGGTPHKQSTTDKFETPSSKPAPNRLSTPSFKSVVPPLTSPTNGKHDSAGVRPLGLKSLKSGAKTVSVRSPKPRKSVGELLRKPSLPSLTQANVGPADNPTTTWDGTISSPSQGTESLGVSQSPAPLSTRKSSAALREQIAKAKAAKRAAVRRASGAQGGPEIGPQKVSYDDKLELAVDHDDPFNLRKGEHAGAKVLKQRVMAARTSGRLNIAALGLQEIPPEVLRMYDLESIGNQDGSWAESVDLTRLVAADNQLANLDDAIFPDTSQDAFQDDDDTQGNIFGGLETLDLHGNLLINVPLGFRRLSQLTSLNLSSNRLENSCLDIVSQMTSLRDLKLAKNNLTGPLDAAIANLELLEMLDLHGNGLSALPPNMGNMSRLRILNLSENRLESLSFESLARLPLAELTVKKNKLSGTLIQDSVGALPCLQSLDVSLNQLTHLISPDTSISLPAIHAVSLSMNRLRALPDVSSWTNLLTLAVDENNIADIPNGLTGLEKLRHADFASNDIRVVPPEISRMSSLAVLRLTGNPLRDRKLITASIDELRETLAVRLEPPPPYQETREQSTITGLMQRLVELDSKAVPAMGSPASLDAMDDDGRSDADDHFATPPTSAPHSPTRSRSHTMGSDLPMSPGKPAQGWNVKSGGLLDLSRTDSSVLDPAMCTALAAQHQVRQAHLHHNLFTCIPDSLSVFGATLCSLSMTHNHLTGDTFLAARLELPALRELNLASNHITSLQSLAQHLDAPVLEKIDVSLNRMKSIPERLKEAFPRLTVLLAANNQLTELDTETIRGLRIVDASNNDIAHLNPRIGLLGGHQGLHRLEVTGNRFKVPRWNILERGTEATLQWLRGRVPAEDMAAWKEENGDDSDSAGH
ncbi:hypothetical protein JDV02_008619 [Purpureocillium takamizusanense]|uniref:Leucine-rich repeat-containing protein 40 n=1 Tax=Purpureocillium takamizusanense TaxID=2060973 RepID=A0A9Q8VEM1_9HYPO|nr:uncharacterized protein JDV02_008619 [Purpureocillium takamizusanense]UNI22758.1 hypothetical protein JDV02_008619 [Purpureocillium takamizusanense]